MVKANIKANAIAILFVIAAFSVITWYVTTSKENQPKRIQAQEARQETFERMRQAKISEWAAVTKQKEIAPGEDLKLVEIPDHLGLTSTRCFIYTNVMFRFAQFVCVPESTIP